MSSDTCIAYFGLRIEISADEVEGVELRSDQRVVAARRAGLKYYFGNFGGLHERQALKERLRFISSCSLTSKFREV